MRSIESMTIPWDAESESKVEKKTAVKFKTSGGKGGNIMGYGKDPTRYALLVPTSSLGYAVYVAFGANPKDMGDDGIRASVAGEYTLYHAKKIARKYLE